MYFFFTQEISDFNKRTIFLNNGVVGEVSTSRLHLLMEAQYNTVDHVLYIITDGMNSKQFLFISPHFFNPEPLLFLFKETEFYIDMIEVSPQVALGALHNN